MNLHDEQGKVKNLLGDDKTALLAVGKTVSGPFKHWIEAKLLKTEIYPVQLKFFE